MLPVLTEKPYMVIKNKLVQLDLAICSDCEH